MFHFLVTGYEYFTVRISVEIFGILMRQNKKHFVSGQYLAQLL